MDGFGVDFHMFEKVRVKGNNAHDLFKYLRLHSNLKGSNIGWNFGKFLVARDGSVFKYYGPRNDPNKLIPDIESLL